eukprot:gene2357-4573_t
MSITDPEILLKKIRKLESNKVCPNCGAESSNLGFGNVCIKFKTFICDMCKTSHQAISHRVKSVTMSTWTLDEVNDLTEKMNGGNKIALLTWLGNAPAIGGKYLGGSRPKAGDKVEIYKKFISDCYEKGMFKVELVRTQETKHIEKTGDSVPVNRKDTNGKVSHIPAVSPAQPTFDAFAPIPQNISSNSMDDSFGAFTTSFSSPTVDAFDFNAFSAPTQSSTFGIDSNSVVGFADFNKPDIPSTSFANDPFGSAFLVPSNSIPLPISVTSGSNQNNVGADITHGMTPSFPSNGPMTNGMTPSFPSNGSMTNGMTPSFPSNGSMTNGMTPSFPSNGSMTNGMTPSFPSNGSMTNGMTPSFLSNGSMTPNYYNGQPNSTNTLTHNLPMSYQQPSAMQRTDPMKAMAIGSMTGLNGHHMHPQHTFPTNTNTNNNNNTSSTSSMLQSNRSTQAPPPQVSSFDFIGSTLRSEMNLPTPPAIQQTAPTPMSLCNNSSAIGNSMGNSSMPWTHTRPQTTGMVPNGMTMAYPVGGYYPNGVSSMPPPSACVVIALYTIDHSYSLITFLSGNANNFLRMGFRNLHYMHQQIETAYLSLRNFQPSASHILARNKLSYSFINHTTHKATSLPPATLSFFLFPNLSSLIWLTLQRMA